jgi:hypothetical protein
MIFTRVAKLVQGGLTKVETEQEVVSRRAAFNMACNKFKKESDNTGKWTTKKQKRSSKHVASKIH